MGGGAALLTMPDMKTPRPEKYSLCEIVASPILENKGVLSLFLHRRGLKDEVLRGIFAPPASVCALQGQAGTPAPRPALPASWSFGRAETGLFHSNGALGLWPDSAAALNSLPLGLVRTP